VRRIETAPVKYFLSFLQTYFIAQFLNDEVQECGSSGMRAIVESRIVFSSAFPSAIAGEL
jgi:hypothetical protein